MWCWDNREWVCAGGILGLGSLSSVFLEGQTRLSEQGLGREGPWQRGDRGSQAPWVHSPKNLSVHAGLAERGVEGQELAGRQGGC